MHKNYLAIELVRPAGGTLSDGWRTAFPHRGSVPFSNSVQRVDGHLEWDIDSLFAN